jgi:hypothetical protein
VAVADVNGDDKLDVIVNNGDVLLGNGDGTFQAAVSYGSGGGYASSLEVGDMNGDGKPDLVVANQSASSNGANGSVGVLLGNGDGTFQPALQTVTPEPISPYPGAMVLADFNGDGRLDVASGAGDFLLLGNGDGTFQPYLILGATGSGIAIGDFNRDGKPDLAVGGVAILLNIASGFRYITTTVVASSLNPAAVDRPVTFTAAVTPAFNAGALTGGVTFYDGTTALGTVAIGNGRATFNTSALALGTHTITASYSGDTNYLQSTSATITQTVNQASTMLTLASSVNPSAPDQPVTFTAAITPQYGGQATGTITFRDGATTLGSATVSGNSASFTTRGLAMGSLSITAVYSGDSNFRGSTSNVLPQVITKATSTTTLVSCLNPSVQGKSVIFTATVSSLAGTPTGNIEYLNGTTVLATVTLTSGSAKYTTSKLPAGSNIITAVYSGDSKNSGSTSLAVNQWVLAATTTTLTSSPNPSAYGQSVVFSATVTSNIGAPPNGETIIFTQGTTVLGTGTMSGGTATLVTSRLAACSNVVTAVYDGDTSFAASISKAVTQLVGKAASKTALSSSPNPSIFGQSVTFTAAVAPQFSGTPTGTVTFKNGTAMLGTATLSGGVASYTTTKLTVGTASITAVYNGSTSFTPSTSTPLRQIVSPASTTITLSSSVSQSSSKQAVAFTATVAAQSGEGTVTGTVTFYDGTTALKTASLNGGATKFTTSTLVSGTHLIMTTYNGSTSFSTSSSAPLMQTVQ